MASFVQHVVSGIASGGIYGLLALALVLVNRTTGVLNFAQGGLATLSAFVCLALMDHGWAFWPAFGATVVLSFAGGALLERAVIRPAMHGPAVWMVTLTVGLLLAIDGLDTWIWGRGSRRFHQPFSRSSVHLGGVALSRHDLGVIGVSLACVLFAGLLLAHTKLGLGLRAVAVDAAEARLVGVGAPAFLAIGFGLAAALGAVAGVLAASSGALQPTLMQTAVLYAFAAAVLGGVSSPVGAVLGGPAVGVLVTLLGTYVHWIDGGLRLALALAVVAGTLLVRPPGLFSREVAWRA